MSLEDEKIWEALKHYKAPEPKPGYTGRFWSKISQKSKTESIGLKSFIPKPWALVSLSFSLLFILGISITPLTKVQNNASYDSEIINNLDLAQHWQGVEHADVLDDIEIIEHLDGES